ncbi:hypothetical protein E2C01_041121 [Portunus trituberculatus]|uniref:Uncharacterized protein n=1 Tax=Portunus trituberculatus TaxID=210409 RepID=A0A5B7FPU2_PORTR|nr:hypothetical protein [Portunus trituberculatus]
MWPHCCWCCGVIYKAETRPPQQGRGFREQPQHHTITIHHYIAPHTTAALLLRWGKTYNLSFRLVFNGTSRSELGNKHRRC